MEFEFNNSCFKYMKYLEPTEYNITVQSKYQDWGSHAVQYFEKHIGTDLNEPLGDFRKLEDNSIIFPRNTAIHEKTFFTKEFDTSVSNSLSTLVLPPGAMTSQEGTYMRLEGYSMILVNAKDGINLTSF